MGDKQFLANKIFEILSKDNPTPKTELNYTNNFTLAVAVILSAQATDISVNKATKELFATYDTAKKMLTLGEKKLKTYISTIGLYNSKANYIIELCKILIGKHNGLIPDNFVELIKLPGIGRKTANVILNCAFHKPTIAVDTHVFRVANRIGLSSGKNVDKVEKELLKNIPKKWLFYAHHWLILHGRYVCKARTPLCTKCRLSIYCQYYNNFNHPLKANKL
ncbi:MAG: endonuclease III [Rickettsiaceae bacterium]